MALNGLKPHLPTPGRARWQPLRIGLVDLFRYDSEEFWFRDGHLLLRGNNGTGKSKVLSLTLPFLFDAQLKSSRVEPDGDPTKKMSWNLLLGKHERRMGYAWIEFGRLAEDGQPQYLTLGCGLSAAAARSQVDSWFFLLDGRRISQDLWLTTPQRTVLTKERLRETLGEYGQVFETALHYRRAIDERLFQLGNVRYSALMDTLIQLRQPQLSKKPDEANLSAALTEALPPLSTDLLTDVADALNQLEEDRSQLQDYESLARTVGQFNERYRHYAKTQTRRQARELRSAQTGFDASSRALKDARDEFETAQTVETETTAAHQRAKEALRASRVRLQVLQSDPVNEDAKQLDSAAQDAKNRASDAAEAETAAKRAQKRLADESATTTERRERAAETESAVHAIRTAALPFAEISGLAEQWAANPLRSAGPSELNLLDTQSCDAARDELRRAIDRRREQIGFVRERRTAVDRAEDDHARKAGTRQERLHEMNEASGRRDAADTLVEHEAHMLLEAWQRHFESLHQLSVSDTQTPLEALSIWAISLQGENPARVALQAAQQWTSERLAHRQSELVAEQQALQREIVELTAERDRLEKGEDAVPAVPPFRAPDARIGRAGAPLWQLVDFCDGVEEAQRAGLEAALEASGLLDAWVAPDGRVQRAADAEPLHDTQLVERAHCASTLAAWLQPSGSSVATAVVERLLLGIGCTPTNSDADETWLSPDGRFRVGAVAGAWTKPVAVYIGYAARAAARARRLEAIRARLSELSEAQTKLDERFVDHARDRERASAEWRDTPADDPLRAAHASAQSTTREYQVAAARLELAEQQLKAASDAFSSARSALARDAQDLHLPDAHEGLNSVDQALARFTEQMLALVHATHNFRQAQTELWRQREREQNAERDAAQSVEWAAARWVQANDAQVRLDTLRESVGAQVAELQEKMEAARLSVSDGESLEEKAEGAKTDAVGARASTQAKVGAADSEFRDRSAARQLAIARLQAFAATDLLAVALSEIEIPDPRIPWTIEPALTLARRAEQALADVDVAEEVWKRVQSALSRDYTELSTALSALGQQSQMEQTAEYGMTVTIVYQNRSERPDRLMTLLEAEITTRRELLSAQERKVLESHLQAEVAAAIQRLLLDAERKVEDINKELHKRPTSTGVRFRLLWQPIAEGADGAPVGLEAARRRLLNTSTDLWGEEDRRVVGAMLKERIDIERAGADAGTGGSLLEQLSRALDYRHWHRFTVQRWQDGQWRKLSGPASSGERALGLTVPLFAAVASFYSQSGFPYSPRLVLLDEVFAGIDDAARAHCMGLIREFDLDFVVTSEREWGCYAELPGVSICHLQRHEDIDAVHVSRWSWDGRAKQREGDPDRRFADA